MELKLIIYAKEILKTRKQEILLFIISFAVLYFETLFIRWIPTQLSLFSFFKTAVLLACFLGISAGFLVNIRWRFNAQKSILVFFALIFIFSFALTMTKGEIGKLGFVTEQGSYENSGFSIEYHGKKTGGIYVICGLFVFITLVFLPLGCAFADIFKGFQPLKGYNINILGNLAGVLVFTGLSFLRSPPYIWFSFGLVACLAIINNKKWVIAGVFMLLVLSIQIYRADIDSLWSPYQKIDIKSHFSKDDRLILKDIFVNNKYHQSIIDITKDYVDPNYDKTANVFSYYRIPYDYVKPSNILIIASGSGNEAAVAVEQGVKEIDAVEIDPVIIELGKKLHPQKPYLNKYVNVINDDARSFLSRTKKKYDLIVQNQLDSHSQYAMSANLRLDSYLYTLESFKSVKDHLNVNGVFAIAFSGEHANISWSRNRFFEMINTVFGQFSCRITRVYGGPLFLIKNFDNSADIADVIENKNVQLATDDWPEFYLKDRSIPLTYLIIIMVILIFSAAVIALSAPSVMLDFDYNLFVLGAAFMLLEIKSISQFSLLFGNTWIVNSIVLSVILIAIFFSNMYVQKAPKIRIKIFYIFLFASIVINYAFPYSVILGMNIVIKIIVSGFVIGVPIFFAGIVFAYYFARTENIRMSLAANLLGCMFGGLGEYASMITGISALSLIALGLYIISFGLSLHNKPKSLKTLL